MCHRDRYPLLQSYISKSSFLIDMKIFQLVPPRLLFHLVTNIFGTSNNFHIQFLFPWIWFSLKGIEKHNVWSSYWQCSLYDTLVLHYKQYPTLVLHWTWYNALLLHFTLYHILIIHSQLYPIWLLRFTPYSIPVLDFINYYYTAYFTGIHNKCSGSLARTLHSNRLKDH